MDNDLLSIAKTAIGGEIGLTPAQSRRLSGETAVDLRADALQMGRELGLVVDDPPPRDRGGRFAKSGGIYDKPGSKNSTMNDWIRTVAGR
jgi:hypothetical protein